MQANWYGWMDTGVFSEWFDLFVAHVTERPLLLLFDGHMTHISLHVIEKALQQQITILKFPPPGRRIGCHRIGCHWMKFSVYLGHTHTPLCQGIIGLHMGGSWWKANPKTLILKRSFWSGKGNKAQK